MSSVTSKEDILHLIKTNREHIVAFGVKSIGLFGSFVTGTNTSSSDVDILVEFFPEMHTFDNFMELSFFLEELLGRAVEIVTIEALSPYIGPHILGEVERVSIAA